MYKVVAIGGTFDRLHKGHIHFITRAFDIGEKVLIGLTSDEYVNNVKSNPPAGGQNSHLLHPLRKSFEGQESFGGQAKFQVKIQNYVIREKVLKNYFRKQKLLNRVRIVKIHDVYGDADKQIDLDAIMVTRDSLEGAKAINKRRVINGLKPLSIHHVVLQKADDEIIIASTRIRSGEISRWGKSYRMLPVWGKKIAEDLRSALKEPIGELVEGESGDIFSIAYIVKNLVVKTQSSMIITVGDQVIRLCNVIGLPVDIAIFDYKVNRKKIFHSLTDLGFSNSTTRIYKTVKNPPGYISLTLVKAIRKALKEKQNHKESILIKVIGEDDLAGVPAILFAPLDSIVLYGQPKKGMVLVKVTEEKKEELRRLITKYA